MIYVPNYNVSTYPCVVIQNATTIRAYHQQPQNNTTRAYTDFYFNSNARYYSVQGQQTFNVNATLPSCISQSNLTNSFWYRNDLDSILIIFLILFIFIILLPLKVISRFNRRLK